MKWCFSRSPHRCKGFVWVANHRSRGRSKNENERPSGWNQAKTSRDGFYPMTTVAFYHASLIAKGLTSFQSRDKTCYVISGVHNLNLPAISCYPRFRVTVESVHAVYWVLLMTRRILTVSTESITVCWSRREKTVGSSKR